MPVYCLWLGISYYTQYQASTFTTQSIFTCVLVGFLSTPNEVYFYTVTKSLLVKRSSCGGNVCLFLLHAVCNLCLFCLCFQQCDIVKSSPSTLKLVDCFNALGAWPSRMLVNQLRDGRRRMRLKFPEQVCYIRLTVYKQQGSQAVISVQCSVWLRLVESRVDCFHSDKSKRE